MKVTIKNNLASGIKIYVVIVMFTYLTSVKAQSLLIPYRSGELWGYCTADKKIVIPPKYELAEWFSEGLAVVAYGCEEDCYDVYDGKFTFIDKTGKEVMPTTYDRAHSFSKGVAWVQKDGIWKKINKKGDVLYTFKEQESLGSIPTEIDKEIPDDMTPKGYKKKLSDSGRLVGYISKSGNEYWDDPEALFFVPIDSIDEEVPQGMAPRLFIDNSYYQFYNLEQGTKLKPFIVYLTYSNGEIQAEKIFPLQKSNEFGSEDKVVYEITDYKNLKPYISLFSAQNPERGKLMVVMSVKVPMESIKENVFFNILSKGINFEKLETDDMVQSYPIINYYSSLYELSKSTWQRHLLDEMVEEIQRTGKILKQIGDTQNQRIQGKENPYSGKMLFDVMENVTKEDIMEFLKYVSARPFIYMGQRHKLAEVFATWVAGGAPRVVNK
ncbi:MAG: WG repeat-containing protein [Cytophagaceae bacterium]|nr:WG repeat-containing protein [Cytophagaceae bacterium]MDW8455216.1 WG repeat-containing protein [Cytophagaceae bacterium]